MTVKLTKYTRGGRSIFSIGNNYYVFNSRHMTHANAEKSPAYKDSFYFGKTTSKIAKYGRYYLVLQNVTKWFKSKGGK